jgi:3'-phosphoadenosine 5'-phosphosulfate sulfotransferase (PAPS reductase)/FAD synthetase
MTTATTEIQTDLFGEDQAVQRKQNLPYAIELLRDRPIPADAPLVVSYGGGRNSTAMLIGMWSRALIPDLILFADTGGELPETYAYIELFSKWLVDKGMPPVSLTSRQKLGMDRHGRYSPWKANAWTMASFPAKLTAQAPAR